SCSTASPTSCTTLPGTRTHARGSARSDTRKPPSCSPVTAPHSPASTSARFEHSAMTKPMIRKNGDVWQVSSATVHGTHAPHSRTHSRTETGSPHTRARSESNATFSESKQRSTGWRTMPAREVIDAWETIIDECAELYDQVRATVADL